MTGKEFEPNTAADEVFADLFSLTSALLSAESKEYFLFTEMLGYRGKRAVTTDVIGKDAIRNAKSHGAIAVDLRFREDALLKTVRVVWADLRADKAGLGQHLYDASRLSCATFVTNFRAAYQGLISPPGLEIVEIASLLDS